MRRLMHCPAFFACHNKFTNHTAPTLLTNHRYQRIIRTIFANQSQIKTRWEVRNMTKARRILTGLLIAAMILVMVCAVFFVAVSAQHQCLHENCRICAMLGVCEQVLRRLPVLAAVLILCALLWHTTAVVVVHCAELLRLPTLIVLKVKLSD